jgi:hypothetical protein
MPKVFVAFGCATEERTSSIIPGECCACASSRCNLRSFWTINGLAGDKLRHHREFPPHNVPGRFTSCGLSSFAHSSEALQVSEVDGASNMDVGLQEKNGRRAGGDKYSTVREVGERQSLFRPHSAYTDWELRDKSRRVWWRQL